MRPLGRLRRRLSDDRGFTIVEVCVAAFVLAVGVTTVVGSMGAGMGLVGHSRQRSAGAGIAQERLERARNVAYKDLALNEDPTYNAEATHPDHNVVENGGGPEDDQYTLAAGTLEPLIINTADGGLKHLDDPFTLAHTEFSVHQYVTWVNDVNAGDSEPSITGVQSYKRVTVVVTWKFPVHTGPKHTVTESTFVSDGQVTIPAGSPSPSPVIPTAPPGGGGGSDQDLGEGTFLGSLLSGLLGGGGGGGGSGNGQCRINETPPEFVSGVLLSGSGTDQGYLNSTSVQFRFEGNDPDCHPISLHLANAADLSACSDANLYAEVQTLEGVAPPPVNVTWQVPPGDGYKSICAVFENKAEQLSRVWGVNVKLDQTRPTVPGNFRQQSCALEGNDRIATFSWDASTDVNFNGYRLYRSYESAPFQLIKQTTALSLDDTSPKNYASARYVVRSYDKAGNESNDSAQIISYSKNQC
jgi:hypothetical protein